MERKLGAAFMVNISGRMEGNPGAKLSAAWRDDAQLPARDIFDASSGTFEELMDAIRRTPEEYAMDAHFFISSPGGSGEEVREWKTFMDAIRSTGGTVSTQVISHAYSAAAWTFMLGDPGHRFMAEDSVLGLHNGTLIVGSEPEIDIYDPVALSEWARKNVEGLLGISSEMQGDTERFLEVLPAEARQRILHDAFSKVGEDMLILQAHELKPAGVIRLTKAQITERVLNQILRVKI